MVARYTFAIFSDEAKLYNITGFLTLLASKTLDSDIYQLSKNVTIIANPYISAGDPYILSILMD